MLAYLLYRLLLFIPTLLLISFLAFWISAQSPEDPVERLVPSTSFELNYSSGTPRLFDPTVQKKQQEVRERLHLYLPLFYLSFKPLAQPDTLYRIFPREERMAAKRLLYRSGDWHVVQAYRQALNTWRGAHTKLPLPPASGFEPIVRSSLREVQQLRQTADTSVIRQTFDKLARLYTGSSAFAALNHQRRACEAAFAQVVEGAPHWKLYVPSLSWHGSQNQYHQWLTGVLTRLDFGQSYETGRDVRGVLWEKLGWTVYFALLSTALTFLISIPLGVWTAKRAHRWQDQGVRWGLFALDAIPSFWMAYLLLIFFANTDIINWFPATFNDSSRSLFSRSLLPLFAYTYGSLAFMSRQMRSSMLEVMSSPYILAARARGIPESRIWWRHGFRNALLPIITLVGGILPAMVGGAVVLEEIFSIDGMGRYTLESMYSKDIPVIVAVFTLLGSMTVVGYLLSDLLYHLVDPRIRYT